MAVVKGGKKLKKGKKKTTDTTSTKQWCFTGCKNNHKFTKSMVQCHLCQTWCHYKCIDEKESDIIGIWCCKSCRKLPETTMQLCEKIDELNRTVNIRNSSQTQLINPHRTLNLHTAVFMYRI